MNPLLTIINDGDKEFHELAAINYNLYFAGTCRRADTGEDWTKEQAENEIKDFIHSRELALLEGLKAGTESKYGKKGTQHGSLGYQGLVLGITSFETPEDKMRDEILAELDKAITHLKK